MTNRTFLHETEYRGVTAMERIAQAKIVLCGVGAVGSNLADSLARQGYQNMKLIDADRVEQHNVGNQVYDLMDVGGLKVEILRNRLFRTCEIEAEIVSRRLDASNAKKFLRGADLIVDAFDNSESRRVVQEFVRANELECVHIGLFEDYCEIIWDEDYRVPDDVGGDVCEYPLARNLIALSVAIAGELVTRFVVDREKQSLSATLGDFAIRPVSS